MIKSQIDIGDSILQLIESELTRALEQEFEEAKSRFDKRKDMIISSIVIHMMKKVDMQTGNSNIILTIKEND